MILRKLLVAPLVLITLSGCLMLRSEHEEQMALARGRLTAAQTRHREDVEAAKKRELGLKEEITRLEGEIASRDKRIDEAAVKAATLQRKVDDSSALVEELRQTLQRSGKSVDKLVAERGSLSKSLEETRARLEELRKAQQAANQRADLYKQLLARFKNMIDSGDLSILLRDGRMVLQLRNDVLFDSGKVGIKKDGKRALHVVAGILSTLSDRKLQVAGHTDNVPINTDRFPSNWELSSARSINVVKFLVEEGVKAELLSAAGYAAYDPVAANDNTEGKAKNRRIEIVLQPNIAELVQVPEEQK